MKPTIIVSQQDWIEIGCPPLDEQNSFKARTIDYGPEGQQSFAACVTADGGLECLHIDQGIMRIFVRTKADIARATSAAHLPNGGK